MLHSTKSLHLISYCSFLFFFCVCACEEPVELDLATEAPKMVVSSNFSPSQTFQISLSQTKDIFSVVPTKFINNAEVTILNGQGKLLSTLDFNKDAVLPFYSSSNFRPEYEKTYQLEVNAPGFPTLIAEDRIPSPVPLKKITLDTLVLEDRADKTVYAFTISAAFTDPNKDRNYYHLRLFYQPVEGRTNSSGFTEDFLDSFLPLNFSASDQDNPAIVFDINKSGVLLQDETFNGEQVQLKFYAVLDQMEVGQYPKIMGELRTVSNNYYQYHTSLSRQLDNKNRPFAEPVTVFSNIENGLGIFAGFSLHRDSVTIVR